MRFNAENTPTTIVQSYAPTDTSEDSIKENFYQSLEKILLNVYPRDFLKFIRVSNARVGNNSSISSGFTGFLGKYGAPKELTDNGMRLLDICVSFGLRVTGTYFQQKDIHNYIWHQRDTAFRGDINHILVRKRWLSAVHDTRVYQGGGF